jgi:nicotinamide mononucleotide adenylyltransferase
MDNLISSEKKLTVGERYRSIRVAVHRSNDQDLEIFSMRCDDLIVNYIQHIRAVWEHILNGDSDVISKMDHAAVRALELTCLKISHNDARVIAKHHISELLNDRQRDLVRKRVSEVDTLIPSFRSLFEDLNYLELLVNALKKLHRPRKWEGCLRDSLECINENSDRAWRELFLYAMRNYYRIHTPPFRNSCLLKVGVPGNLNGLISEANEAQLSYFARYAYRLGFRNIW